MTPTAGIGLKARHFADAMAQAAIGPAVGLWCEVHAENYMVAGGPRLAMLEEVRGIYPLSLHGVGLSLASHELPDPDHLAALKRLTDRCEPFLVSEHLAWSRFEGRCIPDLLPFPRTSETLQHVCRNVDQVQSTLGRAILIENPSHYLALPGHACSETDFLAEIARRTGCGLLLDLNNVHVSSINLGFSASEYVASFPAYAVSEIHLAGALADAQLDLLIDNHGGPVGEPVWSLLEQFVAMNGARPTLIEWDRELPPFGQLMAERDRAAAVVAPRREPAHA